MKISNGSVRKTGEKSWQLAVYIDGKRPTTTIHVKSDNPKEQEREARQALAIYRQKLEKGTVAHSGKMTLRKFYEYWTENYAKKQLQPTTRNHNDFIFSRIDLALGKKRLDSIEPRHILAFLDNLAEPGVKHVVQKKNSPEPPPLECLSTVTIKKHFNLLSALFGKAVKWNMLPYNPASRVDPPKIKRQSKSIYTPEELGRFFSCIEEKDARYKLMVLLALGGGLRREEIFGLRWKHVDFENSTIHIEEASVYIPGAIISKETKNSSSNRLVSLPEIVMNLMKKHQFDQRSCRQNLGGNKIEGGLWEGADSPIDDRVFAQWNGVPSHPHSFNTWLKRFIKRHNLPHASPHLFRHMSASYLINAGIDIKTVSGKLGHSQTSMTLNVYAHMFQQTEQETANTMGTILAKAILN